MSFFPTGWDGSRPPNLHNVFEQFLDLVIGKIAEYSVGELVGAPLLLRFSYCKPEASSAKAKSKFGISGYWRC